MWNYAELAAWGWMVVAFILILALYLAAPSNNDPHGGHPRCTDSIADNGGICWGEPLPRCVTEDQDHPDCYWDGGRNGLGRSFNVIDGEVEYK